MKKIFKNDKAVATATIVVVVIILAGLGGGTYVASGD